MYSSKELNRVCYCSKLTSCHPNAILFNILSHKETYVPGDKDWSSRFATCHCERQHFVCLRNSENTCQKASTVLLKTISFMKSLPYFNHLPCMDQFLLLRNCWVPLFVVNFAQEHITFEVADRPAASILRKILLNDQKGDSEKETDVSLPTLAAVQNFRSCLNKFWSLDLTAKEYAYLKGTILFNPDIPNLISSDLIRGLQEEAQRVLHEVVRKMNPNDHGRFTYIRLMTSSLQTVTQNFVTDLFFRHVIGQADLLDLLTNILFSC